MFEKVNPYHPDKVADRIAGALVDLAYKKAENPKIAVEVLLGHGQCNIIVETSEEITADECHPIAVRIAGLMPVFTKIVKQDEHLAENQRKGFRCGDNGIFKGMPLTEEQAMLTNLSYDMANKYKSDGKYIINKGLIICQSNANALDLVDIAQRYFTPQTDIKVNPLGAWTGGSDVDCGATNRKLGSDMGDAVTGGGLHGKDLSKADVTLNIVCHIKAQETGLPVSACCAIGDRFVDFVYGENQKTETLFYDKCVTLARKYLLDNFNGSFERFAEYGLIAPKI